VPEDEVAERQLEVVHAQCLAENRALMLITPLQCELLLAPVKTDPSAPSALRSARSPVNLIGSPINYANRLIGSPVTSQSTECAHPRRTKEGPLPGHD
jgi:hypothetical protein